MAYNNTITYHISNSNNSKQCAIIPTTQKQMVQQLCSMEQNKLVQYILLAHKVIELGKPNRFGCRIPLTTNWNIAFLDVWLKDYPNRDIIEWLTYGFPISHDDSMGDPIPTDRNHLGATLHPKSVTEYIWQEIQLGATIGPFKIPPFLSRMGILPLSTRAK